MNNRSLAVLLAITGVLLFSTKAIFAKLTYLHGLDAITSLALRMLIALPVYIFIVVFGKKSRSDHTHRDVLYLILFGFLGYYLASYLDFKGLTYIKAGLERLILFVYPTLVILISMIFFKVPVTRNQVLGVVTTYVGILVVFVPELGQNGESAIKGGTLVFLSALTYAGYIAGSGWLIPKFGPRKFTSYVMIISCFLVLGHYTIEAESPATLFALPSNVYFYGFGMAIIATVVPSYVISYAIRGLGANQFSIFGSLGPISTIILAYIFLDESLSTLQLLGGIVVIGGVFVAEYFKKNYPVKT